MALGGVGPPDSHDESVKQKGEWKGQEVEETRKTLDISPNGWQNLSLFRQDFKVPFPDRYYVSYLVEPLLVMNGVISSGCNPYKWPYKEVTGVISPCKWSYGPQLITGRAWPALYIECLGISITQQ